MGIFDRLSLEGDQMPPLASDEFIMTSLFVFSVVSALISGAIAGRRGYSIFVFAGIGFFLGLGGVPLAWLATARRVGTLSAEEGTGFIPVQAPAHEDSIEGNRSEAEADLETWANLCGGLQQGLALTLILFGCGIFVSLIYACTSVMPTFVTLFEGMSLKLPAPTQFLIGVTKIFREPSVSFGCWLGSLLYPAVAYLLVLRSGYRTPVLGRVWLCTDRLWLLYALRVSGGQWATRVPDAVRTRLDRINNSTTPRVQGNIEAAIRRDRDALAATLWASAPAFFVAFGVGCAVLILVAWAIYAPIYQLVGNIG